MKYSNDLKEYLEKNEIEDKVWIGDENNIAVNVFELKSKNSFNLFNHLKLYLLNIKYNYNKKSNIEKSMEIIENNKNVEGKNTLDIYTVNDLIEYNTELGISITNFCKINKSHLYQNSIVFFENAIVITKEVQSEVYNKDERLDLIKEYIEVYSELDKNTLKICKYLQNLGFKVQPHLSTSLNINHSLVAKDSGAGEFGRNGLLVSYKNGGNECISVITIDAEIEEEPSDKNHSWMKKHCTNCGMCIQSCPVDAIYIHPIDNGNGQKTYLNAEKCKDNIIKNLGCSTCIRECAHFQTSYDYLRVKNQ